jgi:ABC-type Fe3+-siderophore transport system permease subunit
MSIWAVLTFLVYCGAFVAQAALTIAAFQTSGKMGFVTLLVPVYAASVGNYRLKTERRRQLAAAWWGALILLAVMFATAR